MYDPTCSMRSSVSTARATVISISATYVQTTSLPCIVASSVPIQRFIVADALSGFTNYCRCTAWRYVYFVIYYERDTHTAPSTGRARSSIEPPSIRLVLFVTLNTTVTHALWNPRLAASRLST